MNIKQLQAVVDKLFSKRITYMSLLQELGEHFYPERADFTIRRTHGTEMMGDLMTSYPVLVRRDLGDQIGQMLRPTAKEWFKIVPRGGETPDNEAKKWLEEMSRRMRLAMYAKPALFNKMAKQGDHDYASFGNLVFSCRPNKAGSNLLYQNWDIRS
jgi:hypothetical protein